MSIGVPSLCGLLLTSTSILFAQDWRWTDASTLTVEGRGFTDTPGPWTRLPMSAQGHVRQPLWNLSRHSAGIVVRFSTDAESIAVRYELTSDALALPHMPATGVSGFDLYGRTDDGWHWIGATRPSARTGLETLCAGLPRESRELALYLPLYNGVESLEIGVPTDRVVSATEPRKERPVVFYGTSITQGACASRPGRCHVAILGRVLDVPTINLGFSGQGWMDLELADLLARIDARVFVIDCLPNMDAAMVGDRALPFLRRLAGARPTVPIILVEDRALPVGALDPEVRDRQKQAREALREAVEAFGEERPDVRLITVSGDALLGDDGEATVDGSHPTDLGFARQADAMLPALRRALADEQGGGR